MHRVLAVASAVTVTLLLPAPADADSSSQEGTRLFLVAGAEKHCQADCEAGDGVQSGVQIERN
jgi:hypothetical protein